MLLFDFWYVKYGLSIIFTCFYALFDIVFMKHNVVYVFVILVEDVYCVAIHDLSPVLTALFSIELGGFNKYYISMNFKVLYIPTNSRDSKENFEL